MQRKERYLTFSINKTIKWQWTDLKDHLTALSIDGLILAQALFVSHPYASQTYLETYFVKHNRDMITSAL